MAEDHVHQAEGTDLGLDLIGLPAETGAFISGNSTAAARLVRISPEPTPRTAPA